VKHQLNASAFVLVFRRVVQQVCDNLRQSGCVAQHTHRAFGDADVECVAPLIDQRPAYFDRGVHHSRNLNWLLPEFDLPAAHARYIQQIVNQARELIRLAFDDVDTPRELRIGAGIAHAHQRNRVPHWCEWIAKFVAKQCQELILVTIGFL